MPTKTINSNRTRTKRATSELESTALEPRPAAISTALPQAEELAKYEKVVPGGAARILSLAERQAQQGLRLQKFMVVGKFILALSAGLLGAMLLLQGSELAGLLIVLADIAACVYTKTVQH